MSANLSSSAAPAQPVPSRLGAFGSVAFTVDMDCERHIERRHRHVRHRVRLADHEP